MPLKAWWPTLCLHLVAELENTRLAARFTRWFGCRKRQPTSRTHHRLRWGRAGLAAACARPPADRLRRSVWTARDGVRLGALAPVLRRWSSGTIDLSGFAVMLVEFTLWGPVIATAFRTCAAEHVGSNRHPCWGTSRQRGPVPPGQWRMKMLVLLVLAIAALFSPRVHSSGRHPGGPSLDGCRVSSRVLPASVHELSRRRG